MVPSDVGRTRRQFLSVLGLTPLASALKGAGAVASQEISLGLRRRRPSALVYLASVLAQYQRAFDVYTNSHTAGNRFNARGRLSSRSGDDPLIPVMDESWGQNPHSGTDCIKCEFRVRAR